MAVIVILLLATVALLGQTTIRKDQVVVTGSYQPIPMEEADRTVRQIQVDQSPLLFHNPFDLLQEDPALDLRQRAPGLVGDLSIRGSSFGQTLVLVNGLRLNDAQTAHNNLDLPFPFEAIQQVEILEGSGSTLYGADALGGAVNFRTGRPETSELRFSALGGSFGTNNQAGSAALIRDRWSEQVTATRELSTGFMPNRDYRTLALGSETAWRVPSGFGRLLLGTSDRPFGAQGFYGNYPSWERTRGWFAGLTQPVNRNTEVDFGYRRHTDLYDLYRYRPAIYENRHSTDSWQAALRRTTAAKHLWRVFYGAEAYRDQIRSSSLGRHVRDRGAAYASLDIRALRRFSLTLGGRQELFTGGQHVFVPSASGGYWLNEWLRLHASASSAFRLPTFTDLYYSDPANLGNPNLRPERAKSFEGGIMAARGHWTADLVVFRRYDRDTIDYVRADANSRWQAANLDRLTFTGASATVRWQSTGGQQLAAAYTGLEGLQGALGNLQSKYVFEYPSHSATLSWQGKAGPVTGRVRLGVLQRYHRDPYPLLEVAAYYSAHSVQPFVQMTNLTNTAFEEIPGVPMPGRAYYGGLQWIVRGRKQ